MLLPPLLGGSRAKTKRFDAFGGVKQQSAVCSVVEVRLTPALLECLVGLAMIIIILCVCSCCKDVTRSYAWCDAEGGKNVRRLF